MEAQPIVDEHAVYLYTLLPAMKGVTAALLKQALKEMKRYYTRYQFGHHLIRFHRIMERSRQTGDRGGIAHVLQIRLLS
jgi:hypothetical protein